MPVKRAEPAVFIPYDVRARDGIPLKAFSMGSRSAPAVVLVNAFGMPVEFMRPLATELVRRGQRVVTWESRGVPNMEAGFTPENCRVLAHSHDLSDVLDFFDVERASVVGWCSGAQISLRFCGASPARVIRQVLLSGAYALWKKGVFSDFQQKMNQLLPICSSSPASAEAICKMLLAHLAGAGGGAEVEGNVRSIVGAIPPEILALTAGVFSSPERLYRYAHMEARFLEEPDGAWTNGVKAETLVIVGDSDEMSSLENSREIARRLPSAALSLVPGGNHYIHYLRTDVCAQVADFITRGVSHESQCSESSVGP